YGDRLDYADAIGRSRTGRWSLGPPPPVRQVIANRQPAASGPLIAKSLQHRRIPVAAGAVREHHHTGRCAVRPMGDAGDIVESHRSLNSGETGPWPWPSG